MKKNILVLGGGGISLIAAYLIDVQNDMEMLGYLNDWVETGSYYGKKNPHKVMGRIEDLKTFLLNDDIYFYIAFAGFTNPKKSLEQIESLAIPKHKFVNLIHPMTSIPFDYCDLGVDILVAPFAQISPEATISDHCALLGNSFVGHGTFLGEFSHVTANAVVGAEVHVGKGVHIGTNSVIKERIKIGNYSIIGSGAVVVKDVPENAIVVGNPARVLKMRDNL